MVFLKESEDDKKKHKNYQKMQRDMVYGTIFGPTHEILFGTYLNDLQQKAQRSLHMPAFSSEPSHTKSLNESMEIAAICMFKSLHADSLSNI